MSSKIWVIIPAAGSGSRMQQPTPKQYLTLGDRTVIEHTLAVFVDRVDVEQVTVCLPANDQTFQTLGIAAHAKLVVTQGGASRARSVLNGLRSINASSNDWVLVHDAARPCLSTSLLDELIENLVNDEVGGILAMPAKDTLKRSDEKGQIAQTIDRAVIWQAQTPQMFRFGIMIDCLERALHDGIDITDEASALEAYSYKPRLIESDARNLKITTPEDLVLAEFLVKT